MITACASVPLMSNCAGSSTSTQPAANVPVTPFLKLIIASPDSSQSPYRAVTTFTSAVTDSTSPISHMRMSSLCVPKSPNARDLAKTALRNLVLQEQVLRIRAHEITRREQQSGLLNRRRHLIAFLRRDAQRLLGEHMLARLRRRQDQFVMPVRLGTNHHRRDFRVRPNGLHIAHHLRVQRLRPLLRARGVMVPHRFYFHVFA